jgi:hypothetical protein
MAERIKTERTYFFMGMRRFLIGDDLHPLFNKLIIQVQAGSWSNNAWSLGISARGISSGAFSAF